MRKSVIVYQELLLCTFLPNNCTVRILFVGVNLKNKSMSVHKGVHHVITDYTKCVETNGPILGWGYIISVPCRAIKLKPDSKEKSIILILSLFKVLVLCSSWSFAFLIFKKYCIIKYYLSCLLDFKFMFEADTSLTSPQSVFCVIY